MAVASAIQRERLDARAESAGIEVSVVLACLNEEKTVAALAQSGIVIGANLALGGFLTALIDVEQGCPQPQATA